MVRVRKRDYFEKDDYHLEGSLKDLFFGLLEFLAPFKKKFFLSIFLIFLSSFFAMASARVIGLLVDEGLLQKSWESSIRYSLIVLLLEGLSLFALWMGRSSLVEASSKSLLGIRKKIFYQVKFISLSYFDKQPEGRTVTRMTYDVESLEEFFSGSLGRLLNAFILFIVSTVAMLFTNFSLGVILLSGLIPALGITLLSRKKVRFLNHKISRYNSELNAKLSEFLRGVITIRIFGWEKWSQKKYKEGITKHRDSFLKANSFYAWNRPLTNFLCGLPLILLFWFGGKQVLSGSLAIGIFVAFIRFCERFSTPLASVTREIHQIQQSLTSAERIISFLKARTEKEDLGPDGMRRESPLKGLIEFKNLSMFYHSDLWVLKNLSFTLRPGEKIGLVGQTGSGKSTTLNLLARLYPFQKGEIFVDGVPIGQYQRSFLRKSIGVVSQNSLFFKGSIRDNLLLDDNKCSEKALKELGFTEWMESKGLSLDSAILENGGNLSEGEKQFISLARVIILNPSILILDEATASMDIKREERVQSALSKIISEKTCIIVAHRIHTLRGCDRILVFKEGSLVEEGTHHELIQKKTEFYNLAKNSDDFEENLIH
ncbi:MAG: ABC transporter ATP-binding protein [Bdellovibrionota bacterium]|nr:ABC transporter ATP-binding protein [Bdellovibrionota bacterium]